MSESRSIIGCCDSLVRVKPPIGWSSELIKPITQAKAIARIGIARVLLAAATPAWYPTMIIPK
jgi:hypothetical protein